MNALTRRGRSLLWGVIGGVVGATLTADADPQVCTAIAAVVMSAVGVLVASSGGVRRQPSGDRRLRWPVAVGVLVGGLAGCGVGYEVIAPRVSVDGTTLAAMVITLLAVIGGRLGALAGRGPTAWHGTPLPPSGAGSSGGVAGPSSGVAVNPTVASRFESLRDGGWTPNQALQQRAGA